MKRSKRLVFWIITLLISLTLVFFIIEVVVRFLNLAPPILKQTVYTPHPSLPYIMKPLSVISRRGGSDEFDEDYQHNSLGFRDIEHSHEKDHDVFRILGLGDSFTYGAGVKFEETYLYSLEEMLNKRRGEHQRIEIIKAGIPRFWPEPERILLEIYGNKFSPDLILVGFVPNDILDTTMGMDAVVVDKSGYLKTQQAEALGSLGMVLYKTSDVARLFLKRYIAYQIRKKHPWKALEAYKDNGFHEKDWQAVEHEYTKIVSIASKIGARVVFVHIPNKGPWSKASYYPPKRLAAWAFKNGAGFIDTLTAMEKASESKPLYWPKDAHPRPDGYAVIALEIYKNLTENGLVP